MSTARFYKAHGAAMRMGDATDHEQRMQEAYNQVRDDWLTKKDYASLVKAIAGNWTSGNCVDYMLPVSQALIADHEFQLHRHLWTRTIKRQVQSFFREYSFIRAQRPSFDDIQSMESSGFNEFDWSNYSDHRVAAAFLLNRIISSLSQWRSELVRARLDTHDPDQIEESLRLLKHPRIEVNRLPPNNSFKPMPLRGTA